MASLWSGSWFYMCNQVKQGKVKKDFILVQVKHLSVQDTGKPDQMFRNSLYKSKTPWV